MKSDIEIAHLTKLQPIKEVANKINISEDDLEFYGKFKAKISNDLFAKVKDKPNGKLVLVTAINPTPAGEGKTTTTIGLSEALNLLGKKTVVALREPSLGPCMGSKGGATGGGYAQVVPMEDINLHFTGDMHAITTAHNLLSAMIDNHIHFGNELKIDTRQITWKRIVDLNDRALRHIVIGLGGKINGVPRETGYIITVASEIMAILCLAEDLDNLKLRLGKIIIGYNVEGKPVTARDLHANGAMTALLKDAIKPNLVQTLEGNPAIIHGGPFANIAHGCNSIRATRLALKLGDIVITEAGFGADLGAEKFFDIKCRIADLKPDAVVIVATARSLKYNGGVAKADLTKENVDAIRNGFVNLEKHISNLQKYGIPVVVTLNHFVSDTEAEVKFIEDACKKMGAEFAVSKVWAHGGSGGKELAEKVIHTLEHKKSHFKFLYDVNNSIAAKIETICAEIYGASGVDFTPSAKSQIEKITNLGFDKLPICIAKTQYSLSDNPSLLGRPTNFNVTVKEVILSAGAGFIVVLTGEIMTMPGLPRVPAAVNIDVDESGEVVGLY